MNIVDRLEYSNIQEYRIGDTECENLVLKALQCGIGNIVIGSSALDLVSDMLEKENNDDIKINIAVSYPSGAYLTEAKVQEIEDLLEIGKKIDGFYAVMQVGSYLSGHKKETQEEMKALVQAAKGIPVKLITEIGVLNKEQINEVCEMAIEAGITSLVTSAGFMPYEVPFAGKEAYETIVSASKGKLEIIANENIQTKEQVEELFKLGIHTKVFETKNAIENGADEIDYVINIGELKNGNYAYIEDEMEQIVKLCRDNNVLIKVIFENCYLEKDEIVKVAEIAKKVKPDFIKTSTGFGPSGATVEDVKLMKETVGDEVKVKAAGGIRDLETCLAMIEAGAERIGCSKSIEITEAYKKQLNK